MLDCLNCRPRAASGPLTCARLAFFYRRRVEASLLGVCTTAVESGAWLTGSGRRCGGVVGASGIGTAGEEPLSGSLFEAGVKRFWRTHPERVDDVMFLGFGGTCAADVFERAEVKLEPSLCPWTTLLNPLTGDLTDLREVSVPLGEDILEQVRYPDVGDIWTQRVASKSGGASRETLGGLFLNPTLSHLLLCTDMVRDKVQDLLEHLLPAVHIVACVESRGALEQALERNLNGTQIVVLQNSSVWANVLARAIYERQGLPHLAASLPVLARPLVLPGRAEASKFLVIDILKEDEESVVTHISNALTIMGGDDERELGFASNERQRLQYAWDLYLLYTFNARRMLFWSRVAHYSFTGISVLITLCAVLLAASSLPEGSSVGGQEASMISYQQVALKRSQRIGLALATSLLPLLSAFLLSVNSRFSPRSKYGALVAATSKVRCAIFKYRSRVGEFRPLARRDALLRHLASESAAEAERRSVTALAGLRTSQPSAAGGISEPTPRWGSQELPDVARSTLGGRWAPSQLPTICSGFELGSSRPDTDFRKGAGEQPNVQRRRGLKVRGSGPERSCPKPSECFADVLKAIHQELTAGVSRMGSMKEPAGGGMQRIEVGLGHRPPHEREDGSISWCRRRASHTDAPRGSSEASLSPDAALSNISADDYLHLRLEPLLAGLQARAPWLARAGSLAQMVSFLGTAVAGALGVLAMREFIPIVLSIVAAVDSVAQFEQLQVRTLATNNALAELQGVLLWWKALSLADRRREGSKEHLVCVTEEAACSEAMVFGCSTRYHVAPSLHGRGCGED